MGKNNWKIEHIKDKKMFAILNETENSYPLGTHFWYIYNDNCKNEGVEVAPNTYKTELSFNACKKELFNCRNGDWYVNLSYLHHQSIFSTHSLRRWRNENQFKEIIQFLVLIQKVLMFKSGL